MSEKQAQNRNHGHKDLINQRAPGMRTNRDAYSTFILTTRQPSNKEGSRAKDLVI